MNLWQKLPQCAHGKEFCGSHLFCQVIAKRGHFGSFLQDEWELLERMITTVTAAVDKPITVKLRVFESMERTVSVFLHFFPKLFFTPFLILFMALQYLLYICYTFEA